MKKKLYRNISVLLKIVCCWKGVYVWFYGRVKEEVQVNSGDGSPSPRVINIQYMYIVPQYQFSV